MLFQLRGRGNPLGVAMLNFFVESKCSILGLSNEVTFVSRFCCRKGEKLRKGKIHYMTKRKQFSQTVHTLWFN